MPVQMTEGHLRVLPAASYCNYCHQKEQVLKNEVRTVKRRVVAKKEFL